MRKLLCLLAVATLSCAAFGQQDQTSDVSHTEHVISQNDRWVDGWTPGYWVTCTNKGAVPLCAGLTSYVDKGTVWCQGTIRNYAGGTLALTNNATNYVYLDPTANCAPAASTSVFTGTQLPLAIAVTSGGVITTITNVRTLMNSLQFTNINGTLQCSQMPTFTGDVSNTNCAMTVTALHLSPTPTLCGTGNYSRGIDANGNATGCTAASAGGVTSFSGDGTLITNSGSTGAVTATLGTAGAHKFWGNNTGSTAAPNYYQPAFSDISGTAGIAQGGTNTSNNPVKRMIISYAGCNGGVAYPAWNFPASSAMGMVCTTDDQEANLTAADGQIAYVDFILPADFQSFNLATINFTTTDTTNGHTVIWNLATACVQPNNNVANPNGPSYNTAGTVTTTIGGSAVSGGVYQATISSLTMTGCSAGYKMRLKLSRATDTDTDTAVQLTDGLTFAYNGTYQ